MQADQIKQLIQTAMPEAEVAVTGDGHHWDAVVISAKFEGLNLLERQRMVYDALGDSILDGSIHALSMKTYTPIERV